MSIGSGLLGACSTLPAEQRPFDLATYEHMRPSIAKAMAQADAERAFPAGASVARAVEEQRRTGAKCVAESDSSGSVWSCSKDRFSIFMPFVTIEWWVVFHMQDDTDRIARVFVNEEATGL